MDIKQILKSGRLQIAFDIAGAIGGFLYWRFVGCNSGTCVIKSVWYWSTLWGAVMGYLVGDMVNDFIIKRKKRRSVE